MMDGQELRRIRKKLDYNLRDFAEKVGISRAQLSKYEREVTGLSEERVNQIKQKLVWLWCQSVSYMFILII
ncbi:helix-turn-helix domain-containing protein [Enterococcus rivorum]|uniref:helix-turn-helix domain-containing protein n=1 Tax=Enterococcus rivorum TaxID=762845 RepID=UPI0036268C10